jgi:hypothetical protein
VPLHVPWHEVVQLASTIAVQPPWHDAYSLPSHAAWTLIGVHCAVQPPEATTLQLAFAETSILPQASIPALASVVKATERATAASAKGTAREARMKKPPVTLDAEAVLDVQNYHFAQRNPMLG